MSEPALQTQVDEFFASTGGDAPAETAPAETPAPSAPVQAAEGQPTTSFWDEPADDEDLPKSLRGKPRREVWEATKNALAEKHQAGFQKNEAEARAKVLEASLEVLTRQLTSGQPQQRPQAAHETLGYRSREDLYARPAAAVEQLPNLLAQNAEQIRQNDIDPIRSELYAMKSEAAREKAMKLAGVDDPELWDSLRPQLAAVLWAKKSPADTVEAWTDAFNTYKANAARLIPQQVAPKSPAPPAGNTRPGAAPAAAAKKAATTGNKHLDKALREHIDVWGQKGVKLDFETLAEQIAGDRGFGGEW